MVLSVTVIGFAEVVIRVLIVKEAELAFAAVEILFSGSTSMTGLQE